MPYAVREAIAATRRTPLLALLSVVAISLSLFVVGLFAVTAYNIRETIEGIEDRVEVVAYLRDEITPAQLQSLQHDVARLPEARSVEYVSRDEAIATAIQELPEFQQAFTDIEGNPLPASVEVKLRAGFRDSASVERVAQRLSSYPSVEEVRYGKDWVGKIVSLRRIAAGASAIIGGAFAAVAAIIIATAVRISVFARREEIQIMKLVGATDGFIQRPFLVEGVITGLIGGIIAVLLTWAACQVVDVSLMRLAWLPPEWAIGGIAAGAVYGFLSSAVAVRRHLRRV
jgi:cell division transport system permease protein